MSAAVERLRNIFAASRRIEDVSVFDDPDHNDSRTIIVPISDDSFQPALCAGEFALVDVADREPVADEGLFLVTIGEVGTRRQMRVAHLRLFSLGKAPATGGPHWSMCFGVRPICSLDGGVSYAPSGDGPLSDNYMRAKIIGRVIGVLGHGARTLNWKFAATESAS